MTLIDHTLCCSVLQLDDSPPLFEHKVHVGNGISIAKQMEHQRVEML